MTNKLANKIANFSEKISVIPTGLDFCLVGTKEDIDTALQSMASNGDLTDSEIEEIDTKSINYVKANY